MIRVERGAPPAFVHERGFQLARERYETFRAAGGSRRSQRRLSFEAAIAEYRSQVDTYLSRTFGGKCAFTEVEVEPAGRPMLHLFRPEADAFDEHREGAPDHYWWTAFWHRNWYHVSPVMFSLKRTIFPVLGERAPVPDLGDLGDEVPTRLLDRAVLLDPCEDHPQLHLVFDEFGEVQPWAADDAPWLEAEVQRRGAETIRLLNLNSPTLVDARRSAVAAAMPFFDVGPQVVEAAVSRELAHAGAIRQVLAQRLLATMHDRRAVDLVRQLAPELVPHLLATPGRFGSELASVIADALSRTHPDLAAMVRTADTTEAFDPEQRLLEAAVRPRPTAPEAPVPSQVIPRTAAVTKVSIRNFQAIAKLDLEVPPVLVTQPSSDPGWQPWRVFLGENGSGKSSVLRALALALAGDRVEAVVQECGLRWDDLLRRGTRRGHVRVEFTGGDVVDLQFTRRGPTPDSRRGLPRTELYVRGFGATRIRSDPATAAAAVRVGNLFDPLQPVVDAQAWLVDLARRKDQGDFNVAALTIMALLGREDDVRQTDDAAAEPLITRQGDEIWVGSEPLRLLSDGYRAIISMACDLMAGAGSGLSDMHHAGGVVLVDELGSYLHPRWKMQITTALRTQFPSMQFFATTHEPLCLRGLVEREVVRVTPSSTRSGTPWESLFETIEESPSRYRVDRLLTSAFFGLDTTIDPDVDREFQEYYALLREQDPGQDARRRDLRARLSQHGVLGYTARDQMIYDAIDRFLAEGPTMEPEARRLQRQATLDHVADIWRNVAARRERRQP